MKQEITEDEYMKKGLAKEIKRVIDGMKIEDSDEFEERSGFRSETCGEDMIYNQALIDVKKAILKLVI